jgi:hypothetical protein
VDLRDEAQRFYDLRMMAMEQIAAMVGSSTATVDR